MTTETTIIDADDGFSVAVPCGDSNGNVGIMESEVVAWRIDGHPDSGELIPVTDLDIDPEDDEVRPGELYAIKYPDGHYRFADGERCANAKELLAAFRRRKIRAADIDA